MALLTNDDIDRLQLTSTMRLRFLPEMKTVLGSIARLDVGSATPLRKAWFRWNLGLLDDRCTYRSTTFLGTPIATKSRISILLNLFTSNDFAGPLASLKRYQC